MKFESILSSKTAWKVLGVLFRRPWDEFYLRMLVKELKASPNIVHRTLKLLEKEQMLISKKVGNTVTYKINGNSSMAQKLFLLHHENRLQELPPEFLVYINKIRRKLQKNTLSVVLYGSVAKGTNVKESDIDIAIIHEGKIDEDVFRDMFAEHLRYVQTVCFTPSQFNELYGKGSEFIRSLVKSGIIIHDRDFFYKYVFMPLPKPSKAYIENLLKQVKEDIKHLWEIYRENKLPVDGMLYPMFRKLSIALLLLNRQIPESRRDVFEKLGKIGEKKLCAYLSRTKKSWDGRMDKIKKSDEENMLKLSEDKLSECYTKLEEYDG